MQNPIQQHLEDAKQPRRLQAGSLIMTAFGDAVLARGGRIWLGSLIALLAPLALNERLIRTAIFRLVKEGWLCAETVGRRADYRPSPAGQRRFEASARHIYAARAPLWDRRWRLVFAVGALDAKAREQLRRAFFWQGFGALGADCFVHPSADLNSAFDALRTDGLGEITPHLLPLLGAAPTADAASSPLAQDADLVKRAWNLDQLASAYANFVTRYRPILAQLHQEAAQGVGADADVGVGADVDTDVGVGVDSERTDERAFLLRTLLIHDYRRLLLRDPALPEVLLPPHWPGHAARLLCKAIYSHLLPASECHLAHHLKLANGSTPPALPMLDERFQ